MCPYRALGFVKEVQARGANVEVTFELPTPTAVWKEALEAQARAVLAGLPGVRQVELRTTLRVGIVPGPRADTLQNVKNMVAVASGKGGVGKSTVAVNLALALQQQGAATGLLDADIYGPSIPIMMGTRDRPPGQQGNQLLPVRAHGLKMMSIGFVAPPDAPVIWRGPMVHKIGHMRAPGFPACSWALEQTMDQLAAKLAMDPVELRLKNIPTVSQIEKNIPYTTTGLRQCIAEGAKTFGGNEARRGSKGDGHVRRGTGMAAGMWGWAGEPSAIVIVRLLADGSVNLHMGASDIGTGTKTVMAMVVSEELGVPLEKIAIEHADTATTQYAPDSGGRQVTLVCAPAVRAAAAAVKAELLSLAAAELSQPVATLRLRDGAVEQTADGKRVPIADLKSLAERQLLIGVGRRAPHPAGKTALPFVAQFAEVEVNTRTGA